MHYNPDAAFCPGCPEGRSLRHVKGGCADGTRYGLVGVEGVDKPAAQCRAVVVHHDYRDLADELAEIGLRMEHA
jgi:hypothetical protein